MDENHQMRGLNTRSTVSVDLGHVTCQTGFTMTRAHRPWQAL